MTQINEPLTWLKFQPRPSIIAGATVACLASASALASIKDDLGYTALSIELGASLPTGAGVSVFQIEARQGGTGPWAPDSTIADFSGKTILELSTSPSGGFSGHATNVGRRAYGNSACRKP